MGNEPEPEFPEFERSCFYEAWVTAVTAGGLTKEQITSSLLLARAIYERIAYRPEDRDIEW
jgi:hypothetical protein